MHFVSQGKHDSPHLRISSEGTPLGKYMIPLSKMSEYNDIRFTIIIQGSSGLLGRESHIPAGLVIHFAIETVISKLSIEGTRLCP